MKPEWPEKGTGILRFADSIAHTALAAGIFGGLLLVLGGQGAALGLWKAEAGGSFIFAGLALCITGLLSAVTFLLWRAFDARLVGAWRAALGGALCLVALALPVHPARTADTGTPHVTSVQRVENAKRV